LIIEHVCVKLRRRLKAPQEAVERLRYAMYVGDVEHISVIACWFSPKDLYVHVVVFQ
jgi:hypothetical protein